MDLVLFFGFPVFNLEICDAVLSGHVPVFFEVPII